uniref:Uncharacterized protein n=1 Tax=viral metagenome TaxID=1070528 RepID=A0A6C0H8V2_9ZZZZ
MNIFIILGLIIFLIAFLAGICWGIYRLVKYTSTTPTNSPNTTTTSDCTKICNNNECIYKCKDKDSTGKTIETTTKCNTVCDNNKCNQTCST